MGGGGWGNKTRETLNQEKSQEYTPNRTLHKSSKEIQWKKEIYGVKLLEKWDIHMPKTNNSIHSLLHVLEITERFIDLYVRPKTRKAFPCGSAGKEAIGHMEVLFPVF